jgi:hypothetical protein
MEKTDIGKDVLSTLSTSNHNFSYTNTPATDSKGNVIGDALQFSAATKGGGEIHAAALLKSNMDESQKIETTAHELFHEYQAELGETGFTVNREVGAYLFGKDVVTTLNYGSLGFGNTTPAGINYQNTMTNLLYSNTLNQNDYNTAINNFHQGSTVNINGLYNRAIIKANDTNPVIKRLFPLVR